MLHAEGKPRCLERKDASAVEPCSKKPKSTEEPYGKSYDGLQSLYAEVHIKKTHSGFIPLFLSEDEENDTTEDLVLSKKVSLGIKPVTCDHSDSLNNIKGTGHKYSLYSNNAAVVNNRENNESLERYKNEGDTELYSTSKVFIGPIYRDEAVQQHKEKKNFSNRNHQKGPKAVLSNSSKKEMASKRSLPCNIPKIEDELSQFYSEIHQIESEENVLDDAERDSHKQPVEYNKWNQIECVISQDFSYSKTTSNSGGGQCFFSESKDHRVCGEQNPYSGLMGHRTGNGQSSDNERNAWEAEKLYNKQAASRFWNDSVPQFNKPEWQRTPPFIIPYGPPPPQFMPPFNFQKPPPQFIPDFNFQEPVSSSHPSNNFCSSNVGPFENTHMNSSSSGKNSNSTSYSRTPSIQTLQNGHRVHDGDLHNGFCEITACWKDAQQTEGSSNVSQQFLESNLYESQKLLLILRGLPGSGKTTLSRILLGQSRDGLVYSTDDYFSQQDGCWSYNVAQLGAAHDWNQKRAKEAMNQGRSPIIIDNTNTQAWEMKPYVEAALEKGYKVEFHEPDTWWKFDPEELEKRNKHGVSREKIIQMLERYEYQVSIPIVINSVLPFHKTSQRPPPQRRQRETVVKKKHQLHKMKQRRKQKRNRKMKGAAIKEVKKKTVHQTHSDKNWSQSPDEDSEDNGKFTLVMDEYLEEVIAEGEVDSANKSSLKYSNLQKGSFCVSGLVDPVASDKPLPIGVLSGDNDPSSTNLPFVANKNVTELLSSDYLPDEIQNERLVDTKNSILEYKNQSSPPRSGCTDAENSPVLSTIEDKAVPTKAISKLGPGRKLSGNKKEASIFFQQETSKKMERNTWAFFCCDLVDEHLNAVSGKNKLCPTWPECLSNVIYEQRPRKTKKLKQVFSERTTEFSDNRSNKELEKGGDGAVLNEGDDRIGCCLPSPLSEMPGIETNNFPKKSVNKASVSSNVALLASPTGKGRCRRIFNLAPNFDLPRQIPIRKDGKVLRNADVLTEPEKVSDDNIRGEDKQSLRCHESPVPRGNAVIVDSLRPNVESLQCNPVPANLTESVDSSKKGVASQIQICTSSLLIDGQAVTPDKTLQTNTSRKNMPPNISTTQPDILYSVKATTEYLVNPVPEQCKNMHQINKLGATKHSRIEDDQCLLSIKSNSLRLPLSLGFALQLVELFGSPLVPLDTLLPDDYVVPLDCTISKEIYLQWKASVEKKQQKDRSKGYAALPAGAAALEDSREVNGQEKSESSDANPQIHSFQ